MLTLLGIAGSIAAAVIGGIFGVRKIVAARKQAPDMLANKKAGDDQGVIDKATSDLQKNDAASIEKDLS